MSQSPTRPQSSYRELGPLAVGGMAELCLAERDDGLVVVIKRIRPPFDRDPGYRGLFVDEGEVCACLDHPGIVRLLDRGEDELGPYLVFEYVEGTDLGVVLEAAFEARRPLEVATALAVAIPLFEALDAAHRAAADDGTPLGVVHRDVSPGNILLSEQGEVVLVDFGVAHSAIKTEHTVAGEMKGKFAYMAPEQTRGGEVDARADLFAAGVVLYECLAGERLFDGPTDADVVQAVREQLPAPLSEKNPEVPAALSDLVGRLLAKERAARPASAGEVAAALEEVAEQLCVERGKKQRVARLARAHPRPAREEHPHVRDLRRRTQRIIQAAPGEGPPTRPGGPGRRAAIAAAIALPVVGIALFAALLDETEERGGARASEVALAPPPLASAPAGETEPVVEEAKPVEETRPVVEGAKPVVEATRPLAETKTLAGTTPVEETRPVERARPPPPAPERRRPPRVEPKPSVEGEAVASPARGFGTLFLESDPWANVSIDGSPLGAHTPLLGLRLPAGDHRVRLENPVFGLVRTIDVTIEAGGETRRFVDLTAR